MLKYIVSDHAGSELKEMILRLAPYLIDLAPNNTAADDYPDFALILAQKLKYEPNSQGIAICGSGQGICMSLNRYKHIRAGLILDVAQVITLRKHNNANVLCLSQAFTNANDIALIMDTFNNTAFSNEIRHTRRITMIS
jgi:ribose 5-phosphate isomerase B